MPKNCRFITACKAHRKVTYIKQQNISHRAIAHGYNTRRPYNYAPPCSSRSCDDVMFVAGWPLSNCAISRALDSHVIKCVAAIGQVRPTLARAISCSAGFRRLVYLSVLFLLKILVFVKVTCTDFDVFLMVRNCHSMSLTWNNCSFAKPLLRH